jgi:pentatricopeptide repeat protein
MHKGGQENNREGSLLGLKVLFVLGFCFLCTQFMIFFLRGFDFLILMRVTVHNFCYCPTTRRGLSVSLSSSALYICLLLWVVQLFGWMKENEKLTAPTYTSFFSVLGKAGRAERALHIFNELSLLDPVRCNVFICNSLLSTLVYNGKVEKALRLFDQLKTEGLQPDVITYSTVSMLLTPFPKPC